MLALAYLQLWNTCQTRAEAAVRESLADLGLDYLDLYLMHWPIAFKVGRVFKSIA